jgi:peptide/nickel transport system permease protein
MFIRRTINVIITIFGVLTLNFFLIHGMPGDPIDNMIPKDPKFDVSLKWKLAEEFHLNDSIFAQYGWYLYNTMTLHWGDSYMQKKPVVNIIARDMRWTMLLVGMSTVLTIILGMGIGAYAAYRRGGAFDVGSTSVTLFFYGMPIFWFAILLQMTFTTHPLGMNWWPQFPPGGYWNTNQFGSTFHFDPAQIMSIAYYLALPTITLAIGSLAGVSLLMRGSLIDVMTDDFILTARAKGLTDGNILRRHAIPNGLPPMITMIAMDVAFVLGGAYQVEVIFNYPGIGWETIKAINDLDFPILQFIVVIGGVAVVLANFVADLILYFVDPRIKIA